MTHLSTANSPATQSSQPQDSKTYERISQAIHFIQQQSREQPSLEQVAQHLQMDPFQLQRLFSQWAGISPKRFLQFLTRQHAKQLLVESRSVMHSALESGLSGPGRLHDLIVNCDAVTPGELGAQGEGLTITYGFANTPLGQIISGTTQRGICHLRFIDPKEQELALSELSQEWPNAEFTHNNQSAEQLAATLFSQQTSNKPLSLLLKGTNFQIQVWQALLQIPSGAIASYSDIAKLSNNPKAQRAIGSAIGKNKLAVLIPCHRVIRETGDFGQYRWGAERKTALLTWEQSRHTLE